MSVRIFFIRCAVGSGLAALRVIAERREVVELEERLKPEHLSTRLQKRGG